MNIIDLLLECVGGLMLVIGTVTMFNPVLLDRLASAAQYRADYLRHMRAARAAFRQGREA